MNKIRLSEAIVKQIDLSLDATNRMVQIFKTEKQGKEISEEDKAFKRAYLKRLKRN